MKQARVASLMLLVVVCISCLTREASAEHPETTCPVRKTVMKKDIVPVVYGLIVFDPFTYSDEYISARKELFPNSNREYEGGCVIDQNSTMSKEVLYCARCREAEEQWGQEHPVITPLNDKPKLSEKMPSWTEIRGKRKKSQ